MCLDALEELLKSQSVQAILTIPTGHNPLGFSMPESNRRRLAELANQFQIPVIEDAMYAELQLTEPFCPTLRHLTKMDGFWSVAATPKLWHPTIELVG